MFFRLACCDARCVNTFLEATMTVDYTFTITRKFVGAIVGRAALASGCVLAVALAGCGGREEPSPEIVRPVKIFTIDSDTAPQMRTFPGTVRAAARVDLAFQVEGTLAQLPVSEGREVARGQLIAQLDQRDFKNRLSEAEGHLARAQAALDGAESEYERILRIQNMDSGATSESMVVTRRENLNKAIADLQSARAAARAAADKLGYTTLSAPFAGIVSRRYVDNFQEVNAKQTIVSIDDLSLFEILVDIPEIVVALMGDPDRARDSGVRGYAEFAGVPGKRYSLRVKEFATRPDPATQTYRVVLEMERPADAVILPGMAATVTSIMERRDMQEAFVIPAGAVYADAQGRSNVWVIDRETMRVAPREVTTGELTGPAGIQIPAGLQPGEVIAVSGVARLREGMQVKAFDGKY
jgi:membrane fusion protein, multidrug efflux system